MADSSENQDNSSAFYGTCSIIDQDRNLSGAAISYISSDTAIPIRGSDRVIENHIIITPAGEEAPSGIELVKGLTNVGVDCGLATMGFASAAGACGGTVVTLGTAAPLCVISAVGLTTSTWKCASSIGKYVNDLKDPKLNKIIESDGSYYKKVNDYIDNIDTVVDYMTLTADIKKLWALKKVIKSHGGKIGYQYTRKESLNAIKDINDATYEAFTYDRVLKNINMQGSVMRFSPANMTSALGKTIKDGLSMQATKRLVNRNGLDMPFSSRRELASGFKDLVAGSADINDDQIKSSINNMLDKNYRSDYRSNYIMHVYQQARPASP